MTKMKFSLKHFGYVGQLTDWKNTAMFVQKTPCSIIVCYIVLNSIYVFNYFICLDSHSLRTCYCIAVKKGITITYGNVPFLSYGNCLSGSYTLNSEKEITLEILVLSAI